MLNIKSSTYDFHDYASILSCYKIIHVLMKDHLNKIENVLIMCINNF